MQLNGDMSASMTERFSVSGALLVTLFGRVSDEHDRFAERAGAVRDISVRIAMNGRFFMTSLGPGGRAGLRPGLRGRRPAGGGRVLTIGTLTALAGLLGQLYGPLTQLSNLRIDVLNALVSFDRVFEVLDLEPMIADAPDARPLDGPPTVQFDHVSLHLPRAPPMSRWPAWSRSPRPSSGPTSRCCTTSPAPSRPVRPLRWSAGPGAARPP